MMFDHFKLSNAEGPALNIGASLNLKLQGDNTRAFHTLLDETVLNVPKEPNP